MNNEVEYPEDKKLKQRLLKLLYDHKEEHVGSCFSCLHIMDEIFRKKNEDDIFILSNGHAAMLCMWFLKSITIISTLMI